MLRYGAETVILWYACHIVFAVVLPQGLDIPGDAFLDVPSAQAGLIDDFVERSAYTDELLTSWNRCSLCSGCSRFTCYG